MKRKLWIMLALAVLAVVVFCGVALADTSGKCGDNVNWSYDTGTGALTISGTGPMWNYDDETSNFEEIGWYDYKEEITSVVIGDGVTTIGDWVFVFQSSMTSVTIPDSVTVIGEGAFEACSELTDVIIPENVTAIGDYAFAYCTSLAGLTIPDGITAIGDYVFAGCESLIGLTIPDGVTSIGTVSFYGCLCLTSMTIPEAVTVIGESAFAECTNLTSVTIMNASAEFGESVFDGCSTDLVITGWANSTAEAYAEANGISFYAFPYGKCGPNATWVFDAETGTLTISGTGSMYRFDQMNYTNRGWNRYIDSITAVVIEDGITSIGDYSFDGIPMISSLTIGNSVREIRQFAFVDCTGLTSLTIPDSVTDIINSAFCRCTGLTSLKLSKNLQTLGSFAFARCTGLTSVDLPDSLKTIQNGAFANCSGLTGMVIPDSVTSIGPTAFQECTSMTSITLPKNLTEIGNSAFSDCTALTSVVIPGSLNYVRGFYGCSSLADLILSEGHLGISGFVDCTSLTKVVIPESVTEIDNYTFSGCTSLVSVTVLNNSASFGINGVLADHSDDLIIYGWADSTAQTFAEVNSIPFIAISGQCGDNVNWFFNPGTGVLTISGTGPMWDYSSDNRPGWYDWREDVTSAAIGEGVTSIGVWAFNSHSNLTGVVIPDSVTAIGNGAFEDCTSLAGVTIPDGVTMISYSAFSGCTSLADVTIPDSVTTIDDSAFYECTGLTDIVLPNSLTTIGQYAFEYCSGLTSLIIPDSVTTIKRGAFSRCTGLTSVTIPDSVTVINPWMFTGCSNLTSVTIPNSVTGIYREAFYECISLTSLTIPDSVTTISTHAFAYCSGLNSLIIPDSVTTIDYNAFYACTGLTSLTIPGSITTFGNYAFAECTGLTSVIISDGAMIIGQFAFENCSRLTSVSIPDSVTTIEHHAFAGCSSLTSMFIPDSVTSIGTSTFRNCTSLTSVTVLNDSADFGGGVFQECSTDLVIHGWAGSTAQAYAEEYSITFKALTLGDILSGSGTASDPWLISSTADWNKIALALENGIDTSEKYFRLMANISISTMIGIQENPFKGHFDGAGHTLTINLTTTETQRGPFAYATDASFEHLRVAGNITTSVHDAGGLVGEATGGSITDCMSSVHIKATSACNGHAGFVGAIDGTAIDGCVFTGTIEGDNSHYCAGFAGRGSGQVDNSIYAGKISCVSNNNTFLRQRDYAVNCYYLSAAGIDRVKGKQAQAVTADAGITLDFGEGTTYNVSGIIAYPVGLSYNGTFYAGPGETVTLNITAEPREGYYPFFTASAGTLTKKDGAWELTMPNEDAEDVETVEDVVISVNYESLSGTCGDSLSWMFDPETGTLTVSGTGAMPDYSSAQAEWYVYRDLIKAVVIEDGVTSVGKSAFQNYTGLTGITLANSVASIGASAFRGCSALTGAVIPDSVTSIGANAFTDCASGFVLYGELDSVAEAYANYYGIPFAAPDLTGTCGENVRWMLAPATGVLTITGTGAMSDFTSSATPGWYDHLDRITAVTIDDGVTLIGAYAFRNMSGVTAVQIPGSVTAIGKLAFYGCTGLTNVTLPDGLAAIGNNAFFGCTGLTGIEIPDSVTSIGYQAFQGCSALTAATIRNPSADIGTRAFANCAADLGISGYPDSTAQSYAERYSIPFASLIPEPTFFLPAALVSIEDSAFSGIAAVAVYIPHTVTEITGDPFAGSAVTYIYGYPDSAAQTLASTYGYTFVPVDDDWLANH